MYSEASRTGEVLEKEFVAIIITNKENVIKFLPRKTEKEALEDLEKWVMIFDRNREKPVFIEKRMVIKERVCYKWVEKNE